MDEERKFGLIRRREEVLQPEEVNEQRAVADPNGVGAGKGTVGFMANMVARLWKTEAATKVVQAQTKHVTALTELDKAFEGFQRQADRASQINDIIADDRTVLEAQFSEHDEDYKEALHQADLAKIRRKRELADEQLGHDRSARVLNEFHSPPPKMDHSGQRAKMAKEIDAISEQLKDEGLEEDKRSALKRRRRALNTELDVLKAGGDG